MTNWLETIINGYVDIWTWILDNVFFFVNEPMLKLFALSFLILNLNKLFEIKSPKAKWTISILYGLYCLFKVVQIKDFILHFDVSQLTIILPYLCMIILPAILSRTDFGRILLNYYTICFYFVLINLVWIGLIPTAGNLVATSFFAGITFVIAQFGGY